MRSGFHRAPVALAAVAALGATALGTASTAALAA